MFSARQVRTIPVVVERPSVRRGFIDLVHPVGACLSIAWRGRRATPPALFRKRKLTASGVVMPSCSVIPLSFSRRLIECTKHGIGLRIKPAVGGWRPRHAAPGLLQPFMQAAVRSSAPTVCRHPRKIIAALKSIPPRVRACAPAGGAHVWLVRSCTRETKAFAR
jgi:hypothetical protein